MKQFILFLFVLLPFCVTSQVNETFDGPELGSDWIGKDRDSFKITDAGRLQLDINPSGSGNLSIGRNIPYSANMQWEFDVCMQYAPSEENKLCVYLYQENPDRFYYVRIGYAGGQKLGLRRYGEKDMFGRQANDFKKVPLLLHVKVTLEENERWILYSRTDGMTAYKLEGSCTYPVAEPQERGNLIFTFYYTKTRSALFSIDNLIVSNHITSTPLEPEEPDNPDPSPEELPRLLDVEPIEASILRFSFNKPVDIEEAVFSISGIGDAYRKAYVNEEVKTKVNALFEDEMEVGKNYTISYSGIKSISGNALPNYTETLRLEEGDEEEPDDSEPDGYPEGAVLINEVMADPKGLTALPETEYVELYNTTEEALSLAGWQFVYGGSAKKMGKVSLRAKGYAVLYRSGSEIKVDGAGIAVPMDNFPSALANAGKELQLLDASGKKMDQVTYAKATAGKSWERTSSGWQLSTDLRGGTPGSANSSPSGNEEEPTVNPDEPDEPDTPVDTDPVRPGEIIINELLPDPYAGGSEYIELYNRSDKALSLSALSLAIRKSDGTLNTRYPLTSVTESIGSKAYILLTKDLEGVSSFYLVTDPSALYQLPKLPVLANTSSTLVLLRSADDTVIDEVSYSSKWHAYSVKNQKGVALERINPDAATQEPANWTSASETAGYGTPGYQNSQYGHSSPGESTGIEPPVWIEETGNYTISYLLDRPGYNCRAFVFNTSGQRVAEISNHELLGTSGEITWSGIASNGSPLQTGVYIFYAEIYHPEGVVKRFKKAFLIR